MVFSSIEFLCLFLPLTVGIYTFAPHKIKNIVLLVSSLLFYAWGEPKYILIMLFSTVFDYANGRLLEHFEGKKTARKIILILSLCVNLGLLGFFKYSAFVVQNINSLTGAALQIANVALPVGISFYTFQTLSYTIDVYLGKVKAQKNILDFGMYICMFPQLIAGPIVRYSDVCDRLSDRKVDTAKFEHGVFRFILGLSKKVLIANQIGALWNELSASPSQPALSAWLGALSFTFQIYFDFSGYSDMAIGMGEMFGFDFPENFRYPYTSKSITEFWRRWHITLSTWFKQYVYIPLGGNRKGKARQIFNLLVVWFLTGLWHGAGWNFILWGLYYFLLLTVEKLFLQKFLSKIPSVFSRIYTMFFVVFGWVIFAFDDMSSLSIYIKSLFGANGLYCSMSFYYLFSFLALFVVAAVGSTRLAKNTAEKLCSKLGDRSVLALKAVLSAVLVVCCIALITADSYNPFLYFRF